jgi:hypothetical protein|tara:strand:- start:97 stop:300 length:204 start_codon:yes stop_codon:yes gene_type:complete
MDMLPCRCFAVFETCWHRGFPILEKSVEMELKWSLRTFARSLDVKNWFNQTAGVLGMRRWSWFGRGG